MGISHADYIVQKIISKLFIAVIRTIWFGFPASRMYFINIHWTVINQWLLITIYPFMVCPRVRLGMMYNRCCSRPQFRTKSIWVGSEESITVGGNNLKLICSSFTQV